MSEDKNVQFEFYLNRQGVAGQKGEKGDKGFSPIITVKENTNLSYVLNIQNELESFETPNLKEGLVPEDRGGTYVRKDSATGKEYFGAIDLASQTQAGGVYFANKEDLRAKVSDKAITPADIDELNIINNVATKNEVVTLDETTQIKRGGLQVSDGFVTNRLSVSEGSENDLTVSVQGFGMQIDTSCPLSMRINHNILDFFEDSLTYRKTDGTEIDLLAGGGGGISEIPVASVDTLGGIKVGENLVITEDGTLNAQAGGSEYTAGQNITIDENNVISATGTLVADVIDGGDSTSAYAVPKGAPNVIANAGSGSSIRANKGKIDIEIV